MQDKTKRRRIISFIFACSLMGYLGYNHEYHPEYAITMNDLSFGRYRKGRVFIGHQDFLDSLKDLTENDILVLGSIEIEQMKGLVVSPQAHTENTYAYAISRFFLLF